MSPPPTRLTGSPCAFRVVGMARGAVPGAECSVRRRNRTVATRDPARPFRPALAGWDDGGGDVQTLRADRTPRHRAKRLDCGRFIAAVGAGVRGENSPNPGSRFEPLNRSAAVSRTRRSGMEHAAAGFQHSRAPTPIHGEDVPTRCLLGAGRFAVRWHRRKTTGFLCVQS